MQLTKIIKAPAEIMIKKKMREGLTKEEVYLPLYLDYDDDVDQIMDNVTFNNHIIFARIGCNSI